MRNLKNDRKLQKYLTEINTLYKVSYGFRKKLSKSEFNCVASMIRNFLQLLYPYSITK